LTLLADLVRRQLVITAPGSTQAGASQRRLSANTPNRPPDGRQAKSAGSVANE
jgi:hypothetical protein